jgi:hypothetical protein
MQNLLKSLDLRITKVGQDGARKPEMGKGELTSTSVVKRYAALRLLAPKTGTSSTANVWKRSANGDITRLCQLESSEMEVPKRVVHLKRRTRRRT